MDKSILNYDLLLLRICEDSSSNTRIRKILLENGINTVGDLVKKNESDLLKLPGLGRAKLNKIWDFLEGYGLELGMGGDTSDKPKEDGIIWEQRRYEIAKDVLASYTTRYSRDLAEWSARDRAKAALEQADALIELLKGKKND